MKFSRQDSHKKAKLDSNWRKPRGLQSKMRLKKRGYALCISVGYGHANSEKHKVKGLIPVVVATIKQLEKIDAKTHGVIIAAKLGDKKREMILNKAKELGLKILNVDTEKQLKSIKSAADKRKKSKEARSDKKKSLEDKVKPSKKDEPKESKSDEEKKDEMKAQKEKVLTQKQ